MEAGFELNDATGKEQLSHNQKSLLALTYKGSGTPVVGSTYGYDATYKVLRVTVTGTRPFIAFRSAAPYFVLVTLNSGSSWTFDLACMFDPGGGAVDWYVFDYAINLDTTDTFGVEVFDAAGVRTYHTSQKTMQVVDVIHIDPPDPADGVFNGGAEPGSGGSYTAGRTYAVVSSTLFERYDRYLETEIDYGPLPPGHQWMNEDEYREAASVSGEVVSVGVTRTFNTHYDSGPASPGPTRIQYGSLDWIVIDVTNY